MNKLENHNYTGIHATIIADSKNTFGDRITSFVVTFPRIVLAEFNTHRMLSRNSASSRAIPFKKMVKMVEKTPFIPIKWQKDHKGMQGTEYIEDEISLATVKGRWLNCLDGIIKYTKTLNEQDNLTKQICNRLLEPFMWHTAIVTATEWENFFALRAHPAAEIHIADLAEKMLEQYNLSTPKELKKGEWHIPFGDRLDKSRLFEIGHDTSNNMSTEDAAIKIATARCARVSYLNFDGSDDYIKDIGLHDNLAEVGHWSPFEHPGRNMTSIEYMSCCKKYFTNDITHIPQIDIELMRTTIIKVKKGYIVTEYGWSGNFRGFIQYRKMFKGENKSDNRIIKK